LPVEAKYSWNFGKLGIGLMLGVNTQYVYKQHSELNLYKENVTNTLTYSDLPVNKITFSGIAGISADVNLNKRFSIFVEPHLRYNFNTLSKSSAVKSTPMFFGGNAGIAFHF
jgi:hypothetical protein